MDFTVISLYSCSDRAIATADCSHIDIIADFYIESSSVYDISVLELFDDICEKNYKYFFFHYSVYISSNAVSFYIDEDELIEFVYSSVFSDLVSKSLVHFEPDASVTCNFLDIAFEKFGYDPFHPDVVQEALDLDDLSF